MKKTMHHNSQLGMGLIEVLISLGLVALIVAATSQFMGRSMNSQSSLELRGDKEAMRRRLTDQIACTATLSPSAAAVCPANGTPVTLRGRNPGGSFVLLPAAGSKVGRWWYRAECSGTGGAINVRAVHLKPGVTFTGSNPASDFMPDPMTNQTVTLSSPQSLLFPAGGELCGSGGQLVPVWGHYVPNGAGQQFINLGGRPQYIELHSPSPFGLPPPPASCEKTADMPGWQLSCQSPPDIGGIAGISFTSSGFFVRGVLNSMLVIAGAQYGQWVYHGYVQK